MTTVIEELRHQLQQKFPQAHAVALEESPAPPLLQPFSEDAFPRGAISEVVPAGPTAGVSLLVAGLLGEPDENAPHPSIVLIDGADGFDPGSFSGAACSRLLWLRCGAVTEMLKAADLIVRDGNLSFVLLDTTGLPQRELSAIPGSAWWRLKGLAEQTGCRLVILPPHPDRLRRLPARAFGRPSPARLRLQTKGTARATQGRPRKTA